MTDDELRKRLAAANPTPPSEPVDPITSDRARAQMEDIMSTATTERSYRDRTPVHMNSNRTVPERWSYRGHLDR